MLEDVGLQPPEHVRAQHVVQLLDLVLLGDVSELLQEALQVAMETRDCEETLYRRTADGNNITSLMVCH